MSTLISARERNLGISLAFASLLCVGSYNAFAKGLTPFLSPVALLVASEALTAVFIVLTFGIVPLWRKLRDMSPKCIAIAAGIGVLNSAIAPMLWFTGLEHTTAVNASLLAPADVLCILFASHFLLKESPTRMQVVGASVVFLGILVVNLSAANSFSVQVGDLLILLATQLFGLGAVLFKKYLSHVMAELALLIRNITGVGVVLGIGMFFEHTFVQEIAAFPLEKVLLLLAFAFFSRYVNLACFYEALDRLPATTISLIEIAAPLSGMVFAVLILGEGIGEAHLIGGGIMALGLALEQVSGATIRRTVRRSFDAMLRPKEFGESLVLRFSRQS